MMIDQSSCCYAVMTSNIGLYMFGKVKVKYYDNVLYSGTTEETCQNMYNKFQNVTLILRIRVTS